MPAEPRPCAREVRPISSSSGVVASVGNAAPPTVTSARTPNPFTTIGCMNMRATRLAASSIWPGSRMPGRITAQSPSPMRMTRSIERTQSRTRSGTPLHSASPTSWP